MYKHFNNFIAIVAMQIIHKLLLVVQEMKDLENELHLFRGVRKMDSGQR